MPEKQAFSNHYQSLFFNYFGIAQLILELEIDGGHVTAVIEPLEIQGRKVTADRATKMLKYVSSKASIDILNELCPTAMNSNLSDEGVQPSEILDKLEKTIEGLKKQFLLIAKSPIKKLRSKIKTIYHPTSYDVDEEGMNWLLENSWALTETESADEALISHDGDYYIASEVQTRKMVNTTDIYENKLIHFCINRIHTEACRLLREAEANIANSHRVLPVRENFVSFYKLAEKYDTKGVAQNFISRIKKSVDEANKLCALADKFIPVSNQQIDTISVTEQVKSRPAYLQCVAYLRDWIKEYFVAWESAVSLAKVTNLPRLFEYYLTVVIDDTLNVLGRRNSESSGLFQGKIHDSSYHLRYEPTYWKPRHRESLNQAIVSVDNEKLIHSINDRVRNFSASSAKKYLCREPDIVIERSDPNGNIDQLYVFDAKCWSDENKMYNSQVPELAMKYAMGLRRRDGKQVVKSCVAINPCPENNDLVFNDFYAQPCNLFGRTPAFPIIGTQRAAITANGEEPGIFKLVKQVITSCQPIEVKTIPSTIFAST